MGAVFSLFARPSKGRNHLFTSSTHPLAHVPFFQKENLRKFGGSDVVPKPVSMRKVFCATGNGVQPLIPVFQLSFLSGNADFKGRKTPNDPCTYHCEKWWLLKKRVLTYVRGLISPPIPLLHILQVMTAVTGLVAWDAH